MICFWSSEIRNVKNLCSFFILNSKYFSTTSSATAIPEAIFQRVLFCFGFCVFLFIGSNFSDSLLDRFTGSFYFLLERNDRDSDSERNRETSCFNNTQSGCG